MLTNFKNYFTVRLSSKFDMRSVPCFPPHLQCIATLPCEKQYQSSKVLMYLTQCHCYALLLTELTDK